MTLGEKIAAHRKRIGMSQEALAGKLNVSRQAISKWETGDSEPELSNIKALSLLFGVSVDNFLSQDFQEEDVQKTNKPPISGSKIRWSYLSYLIVLFLLMILKMVTEVSVVPSFRLHIDIANISSFFDPINMVLTAAFFLLPPFGAGLIHELGVALKAMFCEIALSDDKKERCYKSAKLSLLGTLFGMASILVISFYKLYISMDIAIVSGYGAFIRSISCTLIYGIFLVLAILPVCIIFSKRR